AHGRQAPQEVAHERLGRVRVLEPEDRACDPERREEERDDRDQRVERDRACHEEDVVGVGLLVDAADEVERALPPRPWRARRGSGPRPPGPGQALRGLVRGARSQLGDSSPALSACPPRRVSAAAHSVWASWIRRSRSVLARRAASRPASTARRADSTWSVTCSQRSSTAEATVSWTWRTAPSAVSLM